ncbi:MAG: response regulator [Gemmatimonadota bacterium]|nr:response regulator [Gemmatimonadota bacterium]
MSDSPPVTGARAFGLRTRLMALVLAAVAPFVFLIGMVARQHRFNERASAEQTALDHASVLADRVDSRFGSVETVLLTLAHSVSSNPADSLRNDKLLRDVAKELPKDFAHFAAITSGGRAIGTSDTLQTGKRRPIFTSSASGDTLLGFHIQGPMRLYRTEGPLAIAVSREDTTVGVRVIGLVTIARLQRELSVTATHSGDVATIMDSRGTVIFRSREPSTWLGIDVSNTPFFVASKAKSSGTAAVTDLDGVEVFSGFVTARHVPWIVQVGSPQILAFAKERADFWRAIGFGMLALLIAIILAWTQATRIIVPMRTVVRDAALLSKGDLSHRSSLAASQDEIGVLGKTLNTMAETLEKREDALRRSELRFRAIIENVDDMIVIIAPDYRRLYVSPAMSRILGYTQEELLAFTAQDMIHPSDWPGIRELLRAVLVSPGTSESGQCRYRHKDGSWRIFDGTMINLLDVPGVEGLVVNLRDVTAQAALEGELRQAQKMESVGQLAGGVAHDFNNLLTVITGRIDFLIGAPNIDEEQEADLAEIKKAAERAAELTRQLLAFSRKQLLQPRVLDLNRALDEFEPMLRRLIGEDIRITIERGNELGSINADPGQLQQILMNLALNARDAMPTGGVITFRTCNEITGNGAGSAAMPVVAGEYVMLEVADTGLGMDSATQARIFEPFFTTKGQGKGTGLGLSTVYGIVKQSGGGISVASTPQAGTVFRVYFPRAAGYALAEAAEAQRDPSLSGTETILLVEDDMSVRGLVERVLKSRGYEVLAAEDGGDALRLASDAALAVDMVLTDIVMPEMSGRELVEALHTERPDLRVLYMSGYTDDDIVRRGLNDPGMSFIQKPFTAENLAMQVRKVLDAA